MDPILILIAVGFLVAAAVCGHLDGHRINRRPLTGWWHHIQPGLTVKWTASAWQNACQQSSAQSKRRRGEFDA